MEINSIVEKNVYISDEERQNCRRVVDAYSELYEQDDIVVVDAGRYGFVKLLYYTEYNGFESMNTYTDSKKLFDHLWSDWIEYQLYTIVAGTQMEDLNSDEIFDSLPLVIQKELAEKRFYFAEKAGIAEKFL